MKAQFKRKGAKRELTGVLSLERGRWRALWLARDENGKRVRRSSILGKVGELSEEDARARLSAIVQGEMATWEKVRLIDSADFLVSAGFTPLTGQRPTAIHTRGTIAQLVVEADLLSRGFEVYRAVNPGSSCDLLALIHGTKTIRIEVKSCKRDASGLLFCDISRNVGKFEVLAGVEGTKVHYRSAGQISELYYPFGRSRDQF